MFASGHYTYNIVAKKGTSMLISNNTDEREIVLARNTKMKITAIDGNKISMKVVK